MKKPLTHCLLAMTLGVALLPQNGYSQDSYLPKYIREDAKAFRKLTSYASDNGWLEFRQDTVAVDPDTFFNRFGTTIGIGQDYQMRLLKDETDFRQTRHRRYQLFYKNIIVEGVEYTLHDKDRRLQTAHGRIVENLNLSIANPILQTIALGIALADQKLTITDYTGTDKLPLGELVIARQQDAPLSQNYRLSYAFDIDKVGLKDPVRVYVNALTGEVFRRIPLHTNCFKTSTAQQQPYAKSVSLPEPVPLLGSSAAPLTASTFIPLYNRYLNGQSTLTFETELAGSQYRLSHQNGALITRRDVNQNGSWTNNPDVFNASTNWGTSVQSATTAHWLTQRVYAFYQQFAPDQNGIDRQGTYPRIVADYRLPGDEVDAYWSRNDLRLVFGFAPIGPTNPNPNFNRAFLAADILGHEYTHAITRYNADLEYYAESGALNESISDIFGTAFERYLFPNNWNWDFGEDSYQLRDMANPRRAFPPFLPANGQPVRYLDTANGWQPTNNTTDFAGVHTNSGVMNKWFHTLCTGQGPNGQSITPIAFEDATQVVYWALRYGYLQSTSNYMDARDATRSAAGARFSNCSPQQRQVAAAWRTAGLSGPDCPDECNFTTADLSVTGSTCNQPLTFSTGCNGITGASCANVSYSWSGFGYSGSSIPNTSTITVTAPSSGGSYEFIVSAQKNTCWATYKSVRVNISCGNTAGCSQQAISVVSPSPNQTLTASSFPFYFDIRTQVCDPQGVNQVQYSINGNWAGYVDSPDNNSTQPYTLTAGRWAALASSNNAFTINQPGTYTIQPRLFSNAGGYLDAAPVQITVVQGGGSNPPNPGGGLAFGTPAFDCGSGQLVLTTTGGDGTPVEFQAIGLQAWSTNNVIVIPYYQRNGYSFTLQARQSGTEITPYTFPTSCAGYRLAALEDTPAETLTIMPNPTTGRATVRFRLAAGQSAVLHLVNTAGAEVNRRAVVGTGKAQEESFNLDREPAGLYVLSLESGTKRLTGKVMLQR